MIIKTFRQNKIMLMTVLLFSVCINPVYLYADLIANNTSSYIAYYGDWEAATQYGAGQNDTISVTNDTNAIADLYFYGPYIKYYAKKGPRVSIVEIWIDGKYMESIDLYGPEQEFQVLAYENNDISFGSHTFEIKNTDTRNPSSTGNFAFIDWIECSMLY